MEQLAFSFIEEQVERIRQKYPTGRKHCSYCTRWRHLVDFYVTEWLDHNKLVPRKFHSWCGPCYRAYGRNRYKPVSNGVGTGRGPIDAKWFVKLLNPQLIAVSKNKITVLAWHVNGRQLDWHETRALNRWQSGETKTVKLFTADKWAMRFDLPMWEIEEAAKIAA